MAKREESSGRVRTVVMGAGNILLGDDGIGVHVIRALKESGGLPDGVELIDAGTATLDALPLLDGVERLIIIDAVKGGGPAGAIYRFTPDDISDGPSGRVSLHQISLLDALKSNDLLGHQGCRATIIGVEPKDIMESLELSSELEERIPEIIGAVLDLLNS